jgi:hypothetical protein
MYQANYRIAAGKPFAYLNERDRFYCEEDLEQVFFKANNRDGTIQQFPLIALSIGVGIALPENSQGFGKIVETATELKSSAKRREDKTKSGYFRERRE